MVIGSGATAVTLVPALSERAEHVTMLQRSRRRISPRCRRATRLAKKLRARLPQRLADALVRWKNVAYSAFTYRIARRQPEKFRQLIRGGVLQAFGTAYDAAVHDVDVHFNPSYRPWDQSVVRRSRRRSLQSASLETRVDRDGSYRRVHARRHPARRRERSTGGYRRECDRPRDAILRRRRHDRRRCRTSISPNASCIRARCSKTFRTSPSRSDTRIRRGRSKVDLNARYIARLVRYMKRHRFASATPVPRGAIEREPLLGLTSGYVQRASTLLPLRGPFPVARPRPLFSRSLRAAYRPHQRRDPSAQAEDVARRPGSSCS